MLHECFALHHSLSPPLPEAYYFGSHHQLPVWAVIIPSSAVVVLLFGLAWTVIIQLEDEGVQQCSSKQELSRRPEILRLVIIGIYFALSVWMIVATRGLAAAEAEESEKMNEKSDDGQQSNDAKDIRTQYSLLISTMAVTAWIGQTSSLLDLKRCGKVIMQGGCTQSQQQSINQQEHDCVPLAWIVTFLASSAQVIQFFFMMAYSNSDLYWSYALSSFGLIVSHQPVVRKRRFYLVNTQVGGGVEGGVGLLLPNHLLHQQQGKLNQARDISDEFFILDSERNQHHYQKQQHQLSQQQKQKQEQERQQQIQQYSNDQSGGVQTRENLVKNLSAETDRLKQKSLNLQRNLRSLSFKNLEVDEESVQRKSLSRTRQAPGEELYLSVLSNSDLSCRNSICISPKLILPHDRSHNISESELFLKARKKVKLHQQNEDTIVKLADEILREPSLQKGKEASHIRPLFVDERAVWAAKMRSSSMQTASFQNILASSDTMAVATAVQSSIVVAGIPGGGDDVKHQQQQQIIASTHMLLVGEKGGGEGGLLKSRRSFLKRSKSQSNSHQIRWKLNDIERDYSGIPQPHLGQNRLYNRCPSCQGFLSGAIHQKNKPGFIQPTPIVQSVAATGTLIEAEKNDLFIRGINSTTTIIKPTMMTISGGSIVVSQYQECIAENIEQGVFVLNKKLEIVHQNEQITNFFNKTEVDESLLKSLQILVFSEESLKVLKQVLKASVNAVDKGNRDVSDFIDSLSEKQLRQRIYNLQEFLMKFWNLLGNRSGAGAEKITLEVQQVIYVPSTKYSQSNQIETTVAASTSGPAVAAELNNNGQSKCMTIQMKIMILPLSFDGEVMIVLTNTREHDAWLKKEVWCNVSERICESVSHEFGTYMNIITNVTENALDDEEVSLKMKKQYFRIIHTNSLLLDNLLNDMRAFFALVSHKLEVHAREINIRETLFETLELFKMQLQLKKLQISVNVQKSVSNFIISDSQLIQQVLSNLLSNSLKFTFAGAIKIILRTHSSEQARIDQISITSH